MRTFSKCILTPGLFLVHTHTLIEKGHTLQPGEDGISNCFGSNVGMTEYFLWGMQIDT